MAIDWQLIRTAQAKSLAAVVEEAGTKGVVVARAPDDVLWVVGTSQYDPRRWDISPNGTITRCTREGGLRCRGNKFTKAMLKEARACGANVAIQSVTSGRG